MEAGNDFSWKKALDLITVGQERYLSAVGMFYTAAPMHKTGQPDYRLINL